MIWNWVSFEPCLYPSIYLSIYPSINPSNHPSIFEWGISECLNIWFVCLLINDETWGSNLRIMFSRMIWDSPKKILSFNRKHLTICTKSRMINVVTHFLLSLVTQNLKFWIHCEWNWTTFSKNCKKKLL